MVSESAATQLSVMFSESTGTVCTDNPGFSWESVSLMVSESAATQFSIAISESTTNLCADESTRHFWKHCR